MRTPAFCTNSLLKASSATQKPSLRSVARVNMNVFFRHVARPRGRGAVAAFQIHVQHDFGPLQMILGRGFVEVDSRAVLRDEHRSDADVDPARIQSDARGAD